MNSYVDLDHRQGDQKTWQLRATGTSAVETKHASLRQVESAAPAAFAASSSRTRKRVPREAGGLRSAARRSSSNRGELPEPLRHPGDRAGERRQLDAGPAGTHRDRSRVSGGGA